MGFRGLKNPPFFLRTKVDTSGCTIHTITQKYVTSCSMIVAGCLNVLGVKQSLCTIFSGTPCFCPQHSLNRVTACLKGSVHNPNTGGPRPQSPTPPIHQYTSSAQPSPPSACIPPSCPKYLPLFEQFPSAQIWSAHRCDHDKIRSKLNQNHPCIIFSNWAGMRSNGPTMNCGLLRSLHV